MFHVAKAGIAACIALSAIGTPAHGGVIEGFESQQFAAPWNDAGNGGFSGTSTPFINATGAHDGLFGVADGDGNWQYRTDAAAALTAGTAVSAWFRTTGQKFGAFNLGFGADANGASSFYVHTYYNKIAFQNNDGYVDFTDTTLGAFTFQADKWYLATVQLGPTTTGNIFDTDGTTLLASLTATGLNRGTTGGVAVRGAGELSYDTISVNAPALSPVPEPASWTLMIAGFGLVGAASRRRRSALTVAHPLDIRAYRR